MLRMRHAREPRPRREKRDWRWLKPAVVAVVVLAVALGLGIYAAAASYESVSGLAGQHHVPLHRWYPIGLDGGLIGVTLIDLALTWMRQPLWWLRWIARLFALGTVAANGIAGWPDPVGIILRVWPSVLFVVVVEAGRAVLLRRIKKERQAAEPKRKERDRIPLARWFLAFRPTFDLWKRMKLWRIRSYTVAIRTELARQQAVVKLAEHYAPYDWRRDAPQDLVWMLDTGVRIDEALTRVSALIGDAHAVELAEQAAREAAAETAQLEAERARLAAQLVTANAALEALRSKRVPARKPQRSSARKPAGTGTRNRPGTTAPAPATVPAGNTGPDGALDMDQEARLLILDYVAKGHSASEAGRLAGKTDGYGRQVVRLDRAAKMEPAGGERTEGDMA